MRSRPAEVLSKEPTFPTLRNNRNCAPTIPPGIAGGLEFLHFRIRLFYASVSREP